MRWRPGRRILDLRAAANAPLAWLGISWVSGVSAGAAGKVSWCPESAAGKGGHGPNAPCAVCTRRQPAFGQRRIPVSTTVVSNTLFEPVYVVSEAQGWGHV